MFSFPCSSSNWLGARTHKNWRWRAEALERGKHVFLFCNYYACSSFDTYSRKSNWTRRFFSRKRWLLNIVTETREEIFWSILWYLLWKIKLSTRRLALFLLKQSIDLKNDTISTEIKVVNLRNKSYYSIHWNRGQRENRGTDRSDKYILFFKFLRNSTL